MSAAASPTTFPTAPPPNAITIELLEILPATSDSHSPSRTENVLHCSPDGTKCTWQGKCRCSSSYSRSPCSRKMGSSAQKKSLSNEYRDRYWMNCCSMAFPKWIGQGSSSSVLSVTTRPFSQLATPLGGSAGMERAIRVRGKG